MVHISRTLALFAFVSTGLALALTADHTTTGIEGVSAGHTDDTGVINKAKNGGSDVIAATTFAKDKPADDAVAAPGFVVNTTRAASGGILPGGVYHILNQAGDCLARDGTGIGFRATCSRFTATAVPGTEYVTLKADNGLSITFDYNYYPSGLFLDPFSTVAWFKTESARFNIEYHLYVHDPSSMTGEPLVVSGNNDNAGTISTDFSSTRYNGLYIDRIA
ncbi:hypothetical protein C8R47DRAFT_1074626 [Mycena vitilis]|nr:hypothetical protein C8R47DRAFT_1074626 [Mycena vitilis]